MRVLTNPQTNREIHLHAAIGQRLDVQDATCRVEAHCLRPLSAPHFCFRVSVHDHVGCCLPPRTRAPGFIGDQAGPHANQDTHPSRM